MKKMTKAFILSFFSLSIVGIMLMINGCDKENESNNNQNSAAQMPVLSTNAVSNITTNTAVSGGNVTSDGGSAITAKGVCWHISPTPTLANSKTVDGTGTGAFTSNLSGLTTNTTYYIRAYATNSNGTAYGNQITFTTSDQVITIPCNIANNAMHGYNYQAISLNSITIHDNTHLSEWEMTGNSSSGDLRITFKGAPATGKYITRRYENLNQLNECTVHGVFGGFMKYYHRTNEYDTVYVQKNGANSYSATFCNLTFYNTGESSLYFSTNGNLTK